MEALEVSARWGGGYAIGVEARGHRIAVDEPPEAGGEDGGMMPTEVFLASLASCFCLALAWRAVRDGIELPGLRVDGRAERAGRELRYDRIVLTATADVPGDRLAPLVERARRLCWVSNTLATPPAVEYRSMEVP
ncbi:MAG: OsmC family protein [Solirubrobacteraceae bacterium]